MSEMARFRSLSEENIARLLNDKDSENTKKSTKQHRLIFEFYESFTRRREKKMDRCTQKTP